MRSVLEEYVVFNNNAHSNNINDSLEMLDIGNRWINDTFDYDTKVRICSPPVQWGTAVLWGEYGDEI